MDAFIGRKSELQLLGKLKLKSTASLVCLLGRRRIGKSALIQRFSKEFRSYIEVQGLGPSEAGTARDQLKHFAKEISNHFNIKTPYYEDWDDAFESLSALTKKGEHLILLDEISWMARGDALFSAKLKSAWDSKFKKNQKIVFVLCGSVSSWIEDNILKNTNFEGRISLEINLKELTLPEIAQFMEKRNHHIGSFEKMMVLSVTGGVPKYLEEVLKSETSDENLARLCFNTSGILFNDFAKIFQEIFQRKTKTLERIVRVCLEQKVTPAELAKKMKVDHDSDLTRYLHILELSGFLSRDFYFKPENGNASRLSHLRLKDNYLRFYLKIIEPLRLKIEKGGKIINHFSEIKGFEALMGLQFENLILANRNLLHRQLNISDRQIVSSAPYVQKKTTTTKGACQIDLLIHTDLDVFYICEFKCQKAIHSQVIKDVKKKVQNLRLPRRSSVKPVLVYEGELHPKHQEEIENYFYKVIPFSLLLEAKI